MKILLIEPNETLLKNFMTHLLKRESLDLVCTEGSYSGLQEITSDKYDVVILGPGMTQEDCSYIIEVAHNDLNSKNKSTPLLSYGENSMIKQRYENNKLIFFSNYANNQDNLLDSVVLMKYYFTGELTGQLAIG